ncbi:hypothetical protein CCAX7_62040 [Capsulimonas corticalis]|uniref:Uncharacterized protein n=1 Tax=Capsulimonas corticalis TaxID=2219043 RepID=A0A402CWF8_9BACT|nr:hypothetical protein [Capsulimonas corticalis]BDI34153.1 hypothetical protein CCAX7_62040 [Capsulimonas corticalis]
MAYPTEITIETGGVVREGGGDQNVRVCVTWALERHDDLETLADSLSADLERAHSAVWRGVQGGGSLPNPEKPPLEMTDLAQPRGEPQRAEPEPPKAGAGNGPSDAPATAPQVIALRSHAFRAGKSRAELDALAAERFARDSVELLTKIEAASFLMSLQRDGWGASAAPIA